MKKQKQSTILRQLIRIGVFSALWIALSFLLGFTIAFLPPVLLVLPLLLGLIGGVIYMVMLSKLTIPGGIVISSGLLGLILFSMVPYGMMFFCTLAGGILGEILYKILGRGTLRAGMVGSSFALLGLALGEYIPFVFMQDAWAVMLASDSSGTASVAEWCMNIINMPVMLLLCAGTVLLTCLGCFWGQKIVNQHFKKAGTSTSREG